MKKNRLTGILFIVLLLLVVVIPIIIPKSYSEIIQIHNSPITSINNLEGKVYKIGTPIRLDKYTSIEYINVNGGTLSFTEYYPNSEEIYVGQTSSTNNLYNKSKYWKVKKVEQYDDEYDIIFQAIAINDNNSEVCLVDAMEIGDTCVHGAKVAAYSDSEIIYLNHDGERIGFSGYIETDDYYSSFPSVYVGYNRNNSLEDITQTWELVETNFGSLNYYTFAPTDPKPERSIEFTLTCDDDTINYQDKTTCHFNAKHFIITEDPIILTLKEKDDLELLNIQPNNLFIIKNENNKITINTNYISTSPEDFEFFTFEVRAKKEKNQLKNIEIQNIQYYNDENYQNLETTIKIKNSTKLSGNPLTKRQSIILIIIAISITLIVCSKLLLKKKSV